ncbi:MAG: hypothetical protein EOP49_46760, partial [Sphingobacteriales bacterium]
FTINDVTNSPAVDFSVAAELENSDSNNGALVKEGLGTMQINADTSYTGSTNVNAGTLLVSAGLNGTTGVTVSTGAVLGGNGTIAPGGSGSISVLADGVITPPISVSSAIEGLKLYNPELNTIPIVISILFVLFFIQRFGTSLIGKAFGPMMLIWFGMLGILGTIHVFYNIAVFKALNPYYAFHLLSIHHEGFYVLGLVFLCTTGAEALYSDMGHCGRSNIRVSWIFVKTTLVLNYFGQGAYLIAHSGQTLTQLSGEPDNPGNPFYLLMPDWFLPFGIAIATSAAVIASQALISGSFTMISEAMRLNFWPKVSVKFPTELKGQIYIPSINWLLFWGCVFIVLHFKESGAMEAAHPYDVQQRPY